MRLVPVEDDALFMTSRLFFLFYGRFDDPSFKDVSGGGELTTELLPNER